MLRILFVSGIYSTPRAPWLGVANARILHAMREHATIKVVAPVPCHFPPLFSTERAREIAQLPVLDFDDDGSVLHHLRRLYIPGLHSLQAGLYAASVALPLRRIVAEFRPDVLLSAWAYPDGTAAVALAKWLGLPSVVRAMGTDINDFAQKPRRRPQIAWAMRNAGCVIAPSAALGAEIEKLGVARERIAVIPTGVDLGKFHPVDRATARRELDLPEGPLVLVPSRLSREKGIRYFLEAFPRLDPTALGILLGDGQEEDSLRAQAARLGITARIRFAGFQPEARMKLYYSAADVTCLPSTDEGWPNVLMESLACGCPVVASEVGGVPDIIALTGDGATVPPADPGALGTALVASLARVWDRDAIAAKMGGHTIQRTAWRYYETCAALAGRRPGAAPDFGAFKAGP
jgi:teichuronic acid biosynthesis glycosyltransferase TuaC